MATRRATKNYEDIKEFVQDYQESLSKNMITLDSSCYRGDELAGEIKLDLRFPDKTRIGPIPAQVVFRGENGEVALRLVEVPPGVNDKYQEVQGVVDQEIQLFVDQGLVIRMVDHETIVADYEQQLVTLREEMEKQITAAIQKSNKMAALAAQAGGDTTRVVQRGFIVPDFTALEPNEQGLLGPELVNLLLRSQFGSWTGILQLDYADQQRFAYFDKGGLVGWKSEPLIETEVIGMLLFQNKQITQEQMAESLQIMEEKGVRQGDAFIQMGLMTFSQMVMVLGKQVEFILQKALKLQEGSFRFYQQNELPERFVPPPLKPARNLYKQCIDTSKEIRLSELNKELSVYLNQYVELTPLAIKVIQQMPWKASEQKLIQVINSQSWRLREIFSISPLSKTNTYAFIWSFIQLQFFTFKKVEDSSRTEGRYAQRVRRKKKQLQGGSHFDTLEVHWMVLKNELEYSYKKIEDEFNVSRHPEIPKQFHEDMGQILRQINQAYAALKDDKSRREYRLKLIEKDKIIQSAELLAKKGEMAILRRDRREGVLCFSKALELVPGRADFLDGLRRSTSIGTV